MSRVLNGSDEKILNSTPAKNNTRPWTLSGWIYPTNIDRVNGIITLSDKDSTPAPRDYSGLLHLNNASSNVVRIQTAGADEQAKNAATTNGVNANQWNHIVGAEVATNSRWVVLNGDSANEGTNTDTAAAFGAAFDSTTLGAIFELGSQTDWDLIGRIAECAIWDVELTRAEGLILSKGYSPLFVRPQNLVAYWPVIGRSSPEIDLVGGFNGTLTGTSAAPHPPMIYPSPAFIPVVAAAGAAANPHNPLGHPLAGPFGGPIG